MVCFLNETTDALIDLWWKALVITIDDCNNFITYLVIKMNIQTFYYIAVLMACNSVTSK